jgi:hypothetical protein
MRISFKMASLLLALVLVTAAITILIMLAISDRFGSNPVRNFLKPAEPLVEPAIADVLAARGWQRTGILLEAGETIHVQFLSGEIHDGSLVIAGPAGAGWSCGVASCCEPIPDVDRDTLIARIGNAAFAIGDKNEIAVPASGELQLRINDCDAGLYDNSGQLTIQISPG